MEINSVICVSNMKKNQDAKRMLIHEFIFDVVIKRTSDDFQI